MKTFSEVKTISKELSINEEIRAREVRVVSDTNEQLGIMALRDAIHLAEEKGLDLVEVAPNGKPPVCRIMNYGKYRYEQQKRDKEAKKSRRSSRSKKSSFARILKIMILCKAEACAAFPRRRK